MQRTVYRRWFHPVAVVMLIGAGAHAADMNRRPGWRCHVIDGGSRGADGVRLADVNGDGLMDITTGWEEGGIVRVYVHPGAAGSKEQWPAVTVGRTPAIEDAMFVDLDADGAMDVVSCCEGRERTMFVHWGPKGADAYLDAEQWKQEAICASAERMMWMFAVATQLDGRNGADIVAGGKGDSELGWFAGPEDARDLGGYEWHAICPLGWVMSVILHDMDGDGDADVLVTDRKGRMRGCRWLENPGPGRRQQETWKNHFVGGRDREVMFATVADLDADGREDVLVSAKRAEVLWLRRLDAGGDSWRSVSIPYPGNMGTAKGVAVGDVDGDGRADIVVSCEGANAPRSGVVWMSCEGDMAEGRWHGHEISGPRGIKFDRIELLDLDGDGDLDVLTCEEREGGGGMGVFWYENPHVRAGGRK
mgnify:CR=1 FL=1